MSHGPGNVAQSEPKGAHKQHHPRVFALDLHEVDSEKFQDSRNAGFSWYVLLTTLLVSLSAVSVGWLMGVMNVSKPMICQLHPTGPGNAHTGEFPERILFSDSAWAIAIGILSVGGFLGALVSGTIADSIGRRNALVVNNGLYLAGAVLMGTATTAVHFTLGRFVAGIGCGIASGVVNTYIGEISPFKWRGFYGSFFQLSIVLGLFFGQLASMFITTGTHWRVIVALPGVFALLQVALLPLRVESPRYLLKAHHFNEARHALLTLRRGYDVAAEWRESLLSLGSPDHPAAAATPMSHASAGSTPAAAPPAAATAAAAASGVHMNSSTTMKAQAGGEEGVVSSFTVGGSAIPAEPKHIAGVWQTITGRTHNDLRHLVTCCVLLMSLQQLTGITSVLFGDGSVMLDIFDPYCPLSAPWASVAVCGASLPAVLLCLVFADRLGRRALLLCSLGGMAICCALISIGMFYGPDSMVMAAVFLCYFVFNMGLGTIPWLYISEAIPGYSVGATTVLCCTIYWALSVVNGLIVPLIEDHAPQWLFVVFGSFALLGFFAVVLLVPETADAVAADVAKKHHGSIHMVVGSRSRLSTNYAASMTRIRRSLIDIITRYP
ncbi:Bifunctional purine biosynthesis protein PurH [Coemansia javaensis]|uniref:Bifunctional purine biosynthesis protein PurH n=1 Tax=Coemansia javaensis TaxID=2761396 RepID=A0A9W8LMV3_9FUNG|nr:Bifunctional purine biosynthesis protein PurH [Coemansia javaensis]